MSGASDPPVVRRHFPRLGSTSLASCALTATMFLFAPGAATLQAQVRAGSSDSLKPSGEDEKALKQALAGAGAPLRPMTDAHRGALAALPSEMQAEYAKMDPKAKHFMAGRLQGSKSVLGITVLNYRKAFVKGEAFGHNVFEYVSGKVDEKVAKGELTASQGEKTKSFLQACSHLTPAQRESMVAVLEYETGAGKK